MTKIEEKNQAILVNFLVYKILLERKDNEDRRFTVIRVMENEGFRDPKNRHPKLHSAVMSALADRWLREHNIVPENLERVKGEPILFEPVSAQEEVSPPKLAVSSNKKPRRSKLHKQRGNDEVDRHENQLPRGDR